ncbi:MAG: beta strand repeat-containing protein, partial [Acidimicrobiales bacterium]
GPQPPVSASGNPISAANVTAGAYGLNATPPSGYELVACGATAATVAAGGGSATESVTVPTNGTGDGIFYAQPVTTQDISGIIYLCQNGQTSTPVTGGTIAVTSGPQTIAATANPLAATSVPAGTYGTSATAPSNYQLVNCGGTSTPSADGGTATETVVVQPTTGGQAVYFAQPVTKQTLSGHIYLCNTDGSQSTQEVTGGNISWSTGGGAVTVDSNPFGPVSVQAATYDVSANSPSGYFLTACGAGHPANSESVTVPSNGSGTAVFYVYPNTAQTIAGHIYSCSGGTATTQEIGGGNLIAHITGQTTTPIQGANPLGPTPAAAATYTMDATAPSGYKFVACGTTGTTISSDTAATQSVTVPAGGAGVGKFYVVSTATLAVTVLKTNNAADPAGNNFQSTEAAQNLGETFTYQAVITNPTSVDEIISAVTDTLPSTTGTPVTVCSNLVGTTLPANQSVTCTFTGQAPGVVNATLSDTVSVTVTNVPGNPPGNSTGTSTSTVTTTGQTLTGNIYLCANGTAATTAQVPGGTIGAAGPTTVAAVANPLTSVAVSPGAYTLTATAPTGYTFVATCPGAPSGTPAATPDSTSTSATEPVTVPSGGTGTGTFYVVPVTPGLGVSVIKSNNAADPTGTTFSQTQTAPTLGETFTYQAIIANDNSVAEVISSISDLLPGAAASPECASLVGKTLQPGDSVTCTFPGTAPSTAGSSITDTVTVTTTNIPSNPPGGATGTGTSTVLTTPTVLITKANNAAGTGFGTSETASDTATSVPYQVIVTNNNASPGIITALTDTVNGTVMDICPDLIGDVLQPGQSATCKFSGPVPTSPTTDTAAVTLSVNGILVTATAPSTVFPPVLAVAVTQNPPTTPTAVTPVATPATPTAVAPAQLAFTGAPVTALLGWALALLLGGLALLGGLMVTDSRRRRLALVDGGWVTPSWATSSATRSYGSIGDAGSALRPRSASAGLLSRFQRSGAPARSVPQGASPQGPSADWTAQEGSSGDTRYRPDRA